MFFWQAEYGKFITEGTGLFVLLYLFAFFSVILVFDTNSVLYASDNIF
jgi:hypothetical protein